MNKLWDEKVLFRSGFSIKSYKTFRKFVRLITYGENVYDFDFISNKAPGKNFG